MRIRRSARDSILPDRTEDETTITAITAEEEITVPDRADMITRRAKTLKARQKLRLRTKSAHRKDRITAKRAIITTITSSISPRARTRDRKRETSSSLASASPRISVQEN